MNKQKCECPEEGSVLASREYLYSEEERSGMNHTPGECKGTYQLSKYLREGKKLYLCSCCRLSGDKEIG